jgi:hypothetical protein
VHVRAQLSIIGIEQAADVFSSHPLTNLVCASWSY